MFDGWSVAGEEPQQWNDPQRSGDGFAVWTSGDSMTAANGSTVSVQAAPGDGNSWLQLGGHAPDQTGESQADPTAAISRQISTVAGDSYNLSFDLAASLGADADDASVQVLLDGQVIASYNPASPDNALNWQHAGVTFTGRGGNQTPSIVVTRSGSHQAGDGWQGDSGQGDGWGDITPGVMLDQVALAQTQPLDQGVEGGTVPLQAIDAALADTGGSETLALTLSGLPAGSVLSDGVHSATATAGQAVDITGWNTSALSMTPPADFNGSLNLQVTATSTAWANGSTASVSQALVLDVAAVAQPPQLALTPAGGSVSRSLIDTHWPAVCNDGSTATVMGTRQFAGWTLQPVARGMQPAFEVWSGDGREWLGLTNGMGSRYQTPGISQTVATIQNAQYTFSFNYAGMPGLISTNTQIGVYLDGKLLGSYASAIGASPAWQPVTVGFTGDGQTHTLSVQLINGTDTSTARGAMIDDLNLVETLPESAATVYGFAGQPLALPEISASLAANDPGTLDITLTGLPEGATLSDGVHSVTTSEHTPAIDISGWNLSALSLTVPKDGEEDQRSFTLQVHASSHDTATHSTASSTASVYVSLLAGDACATPVSVNPYVSPANPGITSQSSGPIYATSAVVSPLTPLVSGMVISSPASDDQPGDDDNQGNAWDTAGANGNNGNNDNAAQLDPDSLWNNLSESVSNALFNELGLNNKH